MEPSIAGLRSGRPRALRRLTLLAAPLILATGAAATTGFSGTALAAPPSLCPDAQSALFGPNVCVFSPAMAQSAIQADLNAIATQQVPLSAQFDSQRYAVLFEPGSYGTAAAPLVFQVGYYEEVAGLGLMPQDTVINGQVDAFANALDCTNATQSNCWYNSTVNFWRSLSNLELNVETATASDYVPTPPEFGPPVNNPGAANCWLSTDFWSVSQAAPLRRLLVNGSLVFQQFCTQTGYGGNDFASGGFIADSQVTGSLDFYGNQQYLTRNSTIGGAAGCPNGLWNNVYSGVIGAPAPVFTGACQQNTVVAASPVTEEEPFLYMNSKGEWRVFVPAVQHNSSGTAWSSGSEAGSSMPISSFFVANPSTPVGQIDGALGRGSNLILTPGIYDLNEPIVVPHPDTIVMGLGFATLIPQHGNSAMRVVSNSGVKLSGMIIDAGPVNSPVLLSVGTPARDRDSASNPDLIQDVFFRIGGAETTPVSATVSLQDNADNSIIDDVWAWRADHGNAIGWTVNTADTGVIVTGDSVTAYGLAVEHYQKYEVIWSGQNGTDIFFQNELPYDPPTQADWMATPTQDGFPAFYVTPNVKTFNGYGMGSYVVFIQTNATLFDAMAYESPNAPGVQFHDICTVWIAGSGGDQSIIDGTGGPDTSTTPGTVVPVDVVSYP